MEDYEPIRSGSLRPIEAVLENARGPVDLTGCTVGFAMRRIESLPVARSLVTGVAEVVGLPRRGAVAYQWVSGETDQPGRYRIEWEVTDTEGRPTFFPVGSSRRLDILPALAT